MKELCKVKRYINDIVWNDGTIPIILPFLMLYICHRVIFNKYSYQVNSKDQSKNEMRSKRTEKKLMTDIAIMDVKLEMINT